ncbi:MAG: UbiA family prenyltransferase, partial [Candidatus Thermoplasmatota archaeon]|nr:UbiA family prenyltransferase [Candidatus Thermoplasmatota archaeon]MEC8671771.1 UbiA family prenyltransferase [Candidatus Thermoplasmatota archaeon]MEE3082225.1 UbiA family prenyltransferase [Candidatus Thermoplasmatota archaeon]
KEFSLLVRGSVSLKTSWILFWILQLSCIILSLRFNLEFLYCILGLTAISFAYNMEPFRFKSRPGLDLVSNGLSLGLLIPLAAWSIDQPLLEFPKLFFLSTICYLLALYCPTMAIDVEFDKSFGIQTFATKFGAEFTMKLSWFFTICGVSILLISGYFEIYPWNFNLLIWTGWLLIIEIFVHYFYLPITPNPTYNVVAKGSIILATFEAAATFIFLIIFLS